MVAGKIGLNRAPQRGKYLAPSCRGVSIWSKDVGSFDIKPSDHEDNNYSGWTLVVFFFAAAIALWALAGFVATRFI
jgi:hypothetical protein